MAANVDGSGTTGPGGPLDPLPPARDPGWGGRLAANLVLLLLALLTPYAGVSFALAADACGDADRAGICTSTGQAVAVLAPVAGGLVGLLVGTLGGWLRPAPSRWRWLTAGYAVLAAGVVVGAALAATAP